MASEKLNFSMFVRTAFFINGLPKACGILLGELYFAVQAVTTIGKIAKQLPRAESM